MNFFFDENDFIVQTIKKLCNEKAKSFSFKSKKQILSTSVEPASTDEDEVEDEFEIDEDKVEIDEDEVEIDEDEIEIDEDEKEITEKFTVGMFVIVEYEGELFPGKVLKLGDKDSIIVSCMKKCLSAGSTWMWPSKADVCDYPLCDIKFKNITLNELPGTSRRTEFHIAELEHIWGVQEN